MTALSPRPPRTVRWRWVFLALFVASLAVAGCVESCIPAAQRLAAPVACPDGTVQVVVVSWWESGLGQWRGRSFKSALHCIDAEGGGTEPSGAAVYFLLVGYAFAALTALFFALAFAVAGRRRRLPKATLLALLALVAGCRAGTLSPDEFAARWPYAAGTVYTGKGMARVMSELERRAGGPIEVTHVSLGPATAHFTVQNPTRPENLDDWTYIGGRFLAPSPTRSDDSFTGDLFPLRDLRPEVIPAVVARATRELALEGGRVVGISISRRRGEPTISVSVKGTRNTGSATFSIAGLLLDARVGRGAGPQTGRVDRRGHAPGRPGRAGRAGPGGQHRRLGARLRPRRAHVEQGRVPARHTDM